MESVGRITILIWILGWRYIFGSFQPKIASEAVGVNEITQQSKIGNEKEVSQVQNPGE